MISVVLPILVPTPFLRAMTEFAIKTLRMHADMPFELVVVEADGGWFSPKSRSVSVLLSEGGYAGEPVEDPNLRIDKHLSFNPKIGGVKELNAGLDAATGDYVLFTGNDVIVPPHWDTELLRVFSERKDCGMASLSAFEPGYTIGPDKSMDRIVEGMYSPFTMFRKGWRYDESYVKIYQDSDMVMRMYEEGLRAYRSCRAHLHHLTRMTSDRVEPEKHNEQVARDEKLFYDRWENSPLMMFGMIRFGNYVYGREYQAFVNPINLHHIRPRLA